MTMPFPAPPPTVLDAADLLGLVAHRFPFLLVDRVEITEPGRRVVGTKRVTGNEWSSVFSGDGRPFPMPGLLVVEALAQTSAALLVGLAKADEDLIGYFAALTRVRLREPARPGDTLRLTVELRAFRRGIARLRGVADTDGRMVATAEFVTVVRPRPRD
jgi:3-hydroxyacyl-[acyl-carrier-protein] dehydratase